MQSMRVRSLIGKNGLLQIQLPENGCIQDETFIRHPQPEQAEREPF